MRQKREPNFQVEVIYKEVPDKEDRLRQLWDLLISLPDPEEAENKQSHGEHPEYNPNAQHHL